MSEFGKRLVHSDSVPRAKSVRTAIPTREREFYSDASSTLTTVSARAHSNGLSQKHCVECGDVIRIKAEICPGCGIRQPLLYGVMPGSGNNGMRNKTTAALWAFFLGGFGAHKFYLGRPSLGILYAMFFWTFIPGVIAFIEFIILITMTDEAFAATYC